MSHSRHNDELTRITIGMNRLTDRVAEHQTKISIPRRARSDNRFALLSTVLAEHIHRLRIHEQRPTTLRRFRLRRNDSVVHRRHSLNDRQLPRIEVDISPSEPNTSPRRIPVEAETTNAAK